MKPNKKRVPPSTRIFITHTVGEWEYLNSQVRKLKGCDLHTYLHREISRLKNKHEECPLCVSPADGQKKKVQHRIPNDIYASLRELAARQHKDVATIIDEIIVMRLLPDQKGTDPGL